MKLFVDQISELCSCFFFSLSLEDGPYDVCQISFDKYKGYNPRYVQYNCFQCRIRFLTRLGGGHRVDGVVD